MLPTKKFSSTGAAVCSASAGFAPINSSWECKHWQVIRILKTEDFGLLEIFAKEFPPLYLHRYEACEEGCAAPPESGAIPSPPMRTQHQQRIPGRFFSCCCPGGGGRGRGRSGRRSGESGEPGGRCQRGKSRSEPGIPAAAPGGRRAPGLSQRGAGAARQPLRDPRSAGTPPSPQRPSCSLLPASPRSLGTSPVPSEPPVRPTPLPRPRVSPLAPGAGSAARPCRGSPGSAAPGAASRSGCGGKSSVHARGSPPGAEHGPARPSRRKKPRHRRVLRALKGSGRLLPRRGRRKSEAAASVLLRSGVLCTCPGSCSPWRRKRRDLPGPCAR